MAKPSQYAESLKKYIAARDALKQGAEAGAARLLEQSVGSPANNPVISGSVKKLLDLDTLPGKMVLNLLKEEGKDA